jgi:uncharacterized protein (DUF433 family)
VERQLLRRITLNPDVCQGKPIIRNTRYTVDLVLDLLSAELSEEEILKDYPANESKDIKVCLAFASQLSKYKTIKRIVA